MITSACEIPMAAVLAKQFQESHCANCFCAIGRGKQEVTALTCDDCVEVCYCSLRCQRNDWKIVHSRECGVQRSQKAKSLMTTTMRLCIRVILINSWGNQKPSFNGAIFNDLETNLNEFRSSVAHNDFISDIMTIVSTVGHNFFPPTLQNKEIVGMICSVLCNSFSIIDEERVEPIGAGIYVGLAKHNHSCSSTSHIVFEGNKALLRSPNTSFPELNTISYVSRMLPTSSRRKAIRDVHFIVCTCDLCLNEDVDLIGLASRCPDPNCPGYIKKSQCYLCEKYSTYTHEEVTQITLDLIEKLEKFYTNTTSPELDEKNNLLTLSSLREEYGKILADCNVAILQLDEQIAHAISILADENLPENLSNLAIRGHEHFISRLHIGSPEVTRRLYIACKCLSRKAELLNAKFVRQAYQSSCISHGENHFLSLFFSDLLTK